MNSSSGTQYNGNRQAAWIDEGGDRHGASVWRQTSVRRRKLVIILLLMLAECRQTDASSIALIMITRKELDFLGSYLLGPTTHLRQ